MQDSASNLLTVIPVLTGDKVDDKYKTKLHVDTIQWAKQSSIAVPETCVYLYGEDKGLHVHFIVKESNPRAVFKNHMEKVCTDSACEIFLAFANKPTNDSFTPDLDKNIYMNIEINANGACYAKYGMHRKDRIALTQSEIESLNIITKINEKDWSVDLLIPRELVTKICSYDPFLVDNLFAFNLYKISETKDIEHYASFSKVESETPNFHQPKYFALASFKHY